MHENVFVVAKKEDNFFVIGKKLILQIQLKKKSKMDQILEIENVEDAPNGTKYYFNFGSVELIRSLQDDLRRAGVNSTVLVHAEQNPFCVYYTPKNARMTSGGGWEQD